MTAYTLFAGSAHGLGNGGNTGTFTLGTQFAVSQPMALTGIWWYSWSGASSLPGQCVIFNADTTAQVAGTLNTSPSWSGAAASGWVKCSYDGSVTLTSGVHYVVAVLGGGHGDDWYSDFNGYWTSGGGGSGITNGPLSAPNNAGALNGQAIYNNGASLNFPATTITGYDFGVDVEVSDIASAASQPPPPLIPPGFQSPMAFTAFRAVPQGGALVSGADTGSGADAGSLAAAVSDADTGSGADTGSVAVAVSGADTAAGADTGSVAVAVSDADTGSAADTGSVAVAVSDSDTGSGADTGSVVTVAPQPPPPLIPPGFQSPAAFTAFMPAPQGGTLVSDADTGAGADTGSVAVAVTGTDTAAGADTGSVAVAATGTDTGAAADTGSVAVAVSDADTGTGADAGSLAAAVSDADTGSGADTGSVAVTQALQPPPPLIPPGFQSPMAFAALQRPHPAALPEASGHSAAFLVFFP